MKVLFINRRDWKENIGGDSIQMLAIKKHLEKNGIEVDVEVHPKVVKEKVSNYDLVHIFNTQRISETLYFSKIAKQHKKPVILSPIFYDFSVLEKQRLNPFYKVLNNLLKDRVHLIKDVLRALKGVSYFQFLSLSFIHSFNSMYKQVVRLADILLPNSYAELEFIKNKYNVEERKLKVIHNGVDNELLEIEYSAEDFVKEYKIPFDKFILCVARIDERKNILNLLKAITDIDIPLVLIGKFSPLHREYYLKCKKLIDSNKNVIHIHATLPQEKLVGAYKACHAHVLPSWIETPGLVNLEAGLFGANLILGKCPPVEEYFADKAIYLLPNDIKSIREAVIKAWYLPRNVYKVDAYIRAKFLWRNLIKDYLKTYEEVL